MAGPIPKLSQSKPKSEFFKHLGWSENDERHKRLYQMIMEEAAAGRARTCQDRENLTPQTRSDPRVTAPYSSAMITETARHREVQSIYLHASAETRTTYDRGIQQDGANWDNWIIRWCLWHVFRYRDDRNRGRSSNNNRNSRGDMVVPYPSPDGPLTDGTAPQEYAQQFYDPVRDRRY